MNDNTRKGRKIQLHIFPKKKEKEKRCKDTDEEKNITSN